MTSHCVPCDRSFASHAALLQHRRDSTAHAFDCGICRRLFPSERALNQHLANSPAHAAPVDCADCSRSFSSQNALQQHLRDSQTHPPYDGISPELVKPVYKTALLLRRTQASVQDIVRRSGTTLEVSVVSSLWNAAERLNSLNESPADAQRRAERQRQRSELAQQAEDAFAESLSRQGFVFAREQEQRQQAQQMGLPVPQTPDVRFSARVTICGHPCHWLEFKNYFGFPQNPFLAQNEKRQYKKYVSSFGPGAVVYALGYQKGYPSIEGVGVFRAKEVLQNVSN
ncbi:uncharacterized protein PV06_11641 [Exophiala oligosperma]|uniref:CDAN1-interacting nuclease 1 n=1 Tax=Exophiala oligosperma TaxID=215243 RepID=A0A0D2A6Y3_9EURO|nr:uncharacterized protein PV06_11641 [Exophiala oligosperma]KIW36061.1 hypothetical protein PV06_11641 [Exophiala oligosperma]